MQVRMPKGGNIKHHNYDVDFDVNGSPYIALHIKKKVTAIDANDGHTIYEK